MALFTDRAINETIDLQNYENRILDVASTEGIDLAGKIAVAQDEIANELMMFLLKRLPLVESQWLPQPVKRQQIGVSDVAVTGPLRQWHVYKTLASVYRDAYNNQLNDQYQGKWNEYEVLAKTSSKNYLRIGVGLVAGPIPKASLPVLTTISGSGVASTYYAAATWVDQAGQEGCASDVAQITTATGQQLAIAVVKPPANAAGWNVYVGQAPNAISLQNSTPIALGNSWTMAGALTAGAQPAGGQQPTWYVVDHHAIERG
jgi:hypothetical protein